ncbi:hypothetical protein ACRRTK_015520 [Alexandromys fortis]
MDTGKVMSKNISMHNTVGGTMTGPGAHQLGNTRMPNHDTSVVIQQAMPSPQSSSVITQAPSTNRQIGRIPIFKSAQFGQLYPFHIVLKRGVAYAVTLRF